MEFSDLAAQLEEGQLDSVGQFTVDSERSENQFAKQVVLQPNLFLGRLLQAANVANASQIRYMTQGNEIFVQIVLSDLSPFLSLDDFFAGREPPKGPLQHYLHQAFECARVLRPQRLIFHVVGPQDSYSVNLLDGAIDVNPKPQLASGLILEFATPPRPWRFIDRWLSLCTTGGIPTAKYLADNFRTPEEFVQMRCCFSAVPVFLNGKHIRFRPCRTTRDSRHPEVLEFCGGIQSRFRLAHMQLVDRNLPKSCWFNGPNPSSMQSNRASINGQEFGTLDDETRKILEENHCGNTWALSLTVPCSDKGLHDDQHAWKVSSVECAGVTWTEAERRSPQPLICGQWKVMRASGSCYYVMDRLDFLDLHDCFLRKSPVERDEDQLCCSSFLGLQYSPERPCFVPVKDGFALSAESPQSFYDGSFVVAAVPALKVDLNGTRAVQDGVYDKLVSHFRTSLYQLWRQGEPSQATPQSLAPSRPPPPKF